MDSSTANRKTSYRRGITDVVRISSVEAKKEPLSASSPAAIPTARSLALCVASGKGGTGKTVFSINIGILLSRAGYRVTLIDADLGLANSHLLLGLDPVHDVSQMISGELSIDEVLVDGPHGLRLLPGGSGIAELAELNEGQIGYFAGQLTKLEEETDITLIDCSAGINRQVLRFMASAHEVIVVLTPEVTSMIDAYAVIKNIHRLQPDMHVMIVVNRVQTRGESKAVFDKMREVTAKRLGKMKMTLLGEVPHDRYVLRSISNRRPVVELHPRCYATSCFTQMAVDLGEKYRRWQESQIKSDKPVKSYFGLLAGRNYG